MRRKSCVSWGRLRPRTGLAAATAAGLSVLLVLTCGTTPGTAFGAEAGTGVGTAAGTASGTTSRTTAGTTSRIAAGRAAGTTSRTTAGTVASTTVGTGSGTTAGTGSGTTAGTGSGTTVGTGSGTTVGTGSGTTSRTAAGRAAGTTSRTASGTAAGTAPRTTPADAVRAHEVARERVDRLRADEARPAEVAAAERHRKTVRDGLWDMLRAVERSAGDPVAVDPSGQEGGCPVRRRGRPPHHRTGGPWTLPTRGYWLSAGYAARGARWAHRHTGQDFAVVTGTPVYSVGPGSVHATTCGDAFGNQVVIRHPDGYFTQYAHLSRIDVRKGDRVSPGSRIGLAGATGNVTGPHLHFEVRITPYLGSAVAPLPWLRRKDVHVVPER